MNVEYDEGAIGSDHGQPQCGHSEVEPKVEQCVRSKGRFVNGGKRKQIGSGRSSPPARARIALSCAVFVVRRRRGGSLLRHRMSARVLRMPARGVVADVTRNEPIGRERRELFRGPDKVKYREDCPDVGAVPIPAGLSGCQRIEISLDQIMRFAEHVWRMRRAGSPVPGGAARFAFQRTRAPRERRPSGEPGGLPKDWLAQRLDRGCVGLQHAGIHHLPYGFASRALVPCESLPTTGGMVDRRQISQPGALRF